MACAAVTGNEVSRCATARCSDVDTPEISDNGYFDLSFPLHFGNDTDSRSGSNGESESDYEQESRDKDVTARVRAAKLRLTSVQRLNGTSRYCRQAPSASSSRRFDDRISSGGA